MAANPIDCTNNVQVRTYIQELKEKSKEIESE